jgi:hypothetical protein
MVVAGSRIQDMAEVIAADLKGIEFPHKRFRCEIA